MLVTGALVVVAVLFVAFPQLLPEANDRPATARPKTRAVAGHVQVAPPLQTAASNPVARVPKPRAALAGPLRQVPVSQVPVVASAPRAVAAAPARRLQSAVAVRYTAVDDGADPRSGVHFTYAGAWSHIQNVRDGRSNGTSSRTYREGATASLRFSGRRIELFGVKGPTGGYARLRIDGQSYGLLPFYAPSKEAGALIFASPALRPGTHDAEIVVAKAPAGLSKRRFVNIDGAAYSER